MKCQGVILTICLMFLSGILILTMALNKIVISQQKLADNYADYILAYTLAEATLLNAESVVYNFDVAMGLEQRTIDGEPLDCKQAINSREYIQYCLIKDESCANNSKSIGKGWCANFKSSIYPWKISNEIAEPPCDSYTYSNKFIPAVVPILDDKSANFSHLYNTNNNLLCTQPRYITELINIDFNAKLQKPSGNNFIISELKNARLYRITARSFGKNGDTKVTLQKYVAISQSPKQYFSDKPSKLLQSSELNHNQIFIISFKLIK